MKNQYFGDIRDLFKHDLIISIIQEISSINRFIFIPMLTRNDNRRDGNKIDYTIAKAGTKNNGLITYLEKRVKENRRNVSEIKEYFNSNGIEITIYRETEYFNHKLRADYFNNIDDDLLSNSLILLDPDNGLEIKQSNEKHVLFREVENLYNRMDGSSVLMIYQHFPREDHEKYIERRVDELKESTGNLPVFIHDNEIIFFFLTKNDEFRRQLVETLRKYKQSYPRIFI